MKDDRRPEEDHDAAAQPGLLQRIGHAVTVRELRLIDRSIGLFQHWRAHIEPPAEDDGRHDRRRPGEAALEPAPAAEPAARHGRLRGFLIVIALLLAAGFAGTLFSYSLFSRTIDADDLVIDDLRDQLAQMQKADARSLGLQAKDQQQIAEQKKTIREYAAKVQGYEDQIAQLRQQILALTPPPPPPPPPKREPSITRAGPGQARTPQKTGSCVASGSNAAADLSRCVEQFNRP